MIDLLRQNKCFYIPYLLLLIIGGFFLILFSKVDIHWFINQLNCLPADYFFKVFTHFGDGIVIAFAIVIMLFVKYRHAIAVTISSILTTILVQLFKRYIIPDVDRPSVVFESIKKLHFVEGITMNTAHSFPSGHTATGFSIFLLFALISDNKNLKILFFIIAFLVAYSRIYLSQHFLVDIYFGSIIGVLSTSIVFLWASKWKSNKFDLSILDIFKKKKNAFEK